MSHYIVATLKDGEEKYRPPKQAPNPEEAVLLRGVVPEDYDKVYVYPVMETPAGNCMVYKKEDLDLNGEK